MESCIGTQVKTGDRKTELESVLVEYTRNGEHQHHSRDIGEEERGELREV